MANNYEVNGTYGSGKTPCIVFVSEDRKGGKWYVCEGSKNVNYSFDEIGEGVDIEELSDDDIFTAGSPINSLDELIEAIES